MPVVNFGAISKILLIQVQKLFHDATKFVSVEIWFKTLSSNQGMGTALHDLSDQSERLSNKFLANIESLTEYSLQIFFDQSRVLIYL